MHFTPPQKFVHHALRIGALELLPEGRELKSKRISPYFFNSGLFNNGQNIDGLADAYASRFASLAPCPEVIFGPAYKGIPLATATSIKLWKNHNINVGYSFNRKEAKDHGEGGLIVGASLKGKTVGITDDVMTTGASIIEAKEIIQQEGGRVSCVIIAFDRQERGVDTPLSAVTAFSRKHGIAVHACATLDDLIEVIKIDEQYSHMLPMLLDYRNRYQAAA